MADTQPLNATFFAFRKREGSLLLGAGISYGIAMIVLLALFFGALWAILGQDVLSFSRQMSEMAAKSGAATPAALPPNFGRIFLIFPIELIWFFFIFVLLASFESACLRWLIRGERSGPLNLCFGADMWRVYGAYWAWFLYFFCTYILFVIVIVVVSMIGAGLSGGNKDHSIVGGLVVFLAVIAWIIGWIYVAVRLAPAAATTIGAGNFAPLKAWSVSRGRFWALFGAYLIVFFLWLAALLVVGGISMGSMFASVFSHVDWAAARSDPTAFSRSYAEAMSSMYANPVSMALYFGGQILLQVVGIVIYIMFYGVNARAVQAALEEGKIAHEPAA
jgi:hypothetical protein